MSFVIEDDSDGGDDKKTSWLQPESGEELPDTPRRAAHGHFGGGQRVRSRKMQDTVYEKESKSLVKVVYCLWGWNGLLQLINLVLTLVVTFGTRRGKASSLKWLLILTLFNLFVFTGGVFLGLYGQRMKSKSWLRYASIWHAGFCVWSVVWWIVDLTFVLILSRQHGKWMKGGVFSKEEIWEFNVYVITIVFIDALSTIACFFSGQKLWRLASCQDVKEVVQHPTRRGRSLYDEEYGTFEPAVTRSRIADKQLGRAYGLI